jgi:hypothetical protein
MRRAPPIITSCSAAGNVFTYSPMSFYQDTAGPAGAEEEPGHPAPGPANSAGVPPVGHTHDVRCRAAINGTCFFPKKMSTERCLT